MDNQKDSLQPDIYQQQQPANFVPMQQVSPYPEFQQFPYGQLPVYVNDNTKTMGIMSLVFSCVGLCCFGLQFSIIGIIFGIISKVQAKKTGQKSSHALAGIIVGGVSVVLAIIVMIVYIALIASSLINLSDYF